MPRKVIISCAVTGAIHTPSMSEHLPYTPEDIAGHAIEAVKAGAAAVHIHARDPQTGQPSADMDLFARIIDMIKSETNGIICTTTGGGANHTVEERMRVVPTFAPELASCNMGSINFGLFPMAQKDREWKFEWEQQLLSATRDFVFKNTFQDLETALKIMAEAGTIPELEVYDAGHIDNVAYLINSGLLKTPVYLQFVLGILGGMAASVDNLVFLKQTADRVLGPDNYVFSGFGAGRQEFPICTASVLMGGHCRVGLEDNLYLSKGVLAPSNAALVEKMVRILDEFAMQPATPDQAREILGLQDR